MERTPLHVRYRYHGRLAGAPYEVQPRLHWWSSTVRSARHGIAVTDIAWQDEQQQVSKRAVVAVPLRAPTAEAPLRADDRVWVQCVVQSPNHEGMYAGARAGAASVLLADVHAAVVRDGRFRATLPLLMEQVTGRGGQPYERGTLEVEVSGDANGGVRAWTFAAPGAYDLTPGNERRVRRLLELHVMVGSMFPYEQQAARLRIAFEAAAPSVEAIHAPWWQANVRVPGYAYWLAYSAYEPDEPFMENLARVALARHGVSADQFVRVVDGQFARGDDGGAYDEQFTLQAVVVTMDACAIPSTSLPYKSDETYLPTARTRAGTGTRWRKRVIESFNDALAMRGDDCEGLGALIHRVARTMKLGMPERRGTRSWDATGGWRDPVLQRMQRVLSLYASTGVLGSVTAARVGGAKQRAQPMIINSPEDRAAQIGGHMWQESVPLVELRELMRRASPSQPATALPGTARAPRWHRRLPHTVGEGTGAVHPLLRPVGEYFVRGAAATAADNAKRERAEAERTLHVALQRHVTQRSRYLRMGQMQRVQSRLRDVPDARDSEFYRRATTMFTDELQRFGYNVAEMVWTETAPHARDGDGSGSAWRWGVNARDRMRIGDADGRHIGLVVVSGGTAEEMDAVRSVLRQLPPLTSPTLSASARLKLEQYAAPYVERFQREAQRITAGRKRGARHGRVNVIFRRAEFFRARVGAEKDAPWLRDALLQDLEAIESVYRVRAVFETITDHVYNVRIELYMNEPDGAAADADGDGTEQHGLGAAASHLLDLLTRWVPLESGGGNQEEMTQILYFSDQCDRSSFCNGVEGRAPPPSSVALPPRQLRAYADGQRAQEDAERTGFLLRAHR